MKTSTHKAASENAARKLAQQMIDSLSVAWEQGYEAALAPSRTIVGGATTTTVAPAIGKRWIGGVYAGIVRGDDGGQDYHLVVGETETTLDWKAALEWAKQQTADGFDGFELPKRKEQAVMFGNVPELFAKEWYWSAEQYASGDDYAWYQGFYGGYQSFSHKTNALRARAVRRLSIE